jgi:sigma-54 dependent transcriptional regulator, acetoin dehydrogenase operon transcriptional activator AcoR
VWARAEMRARDGRRGLVATVPPPSMVSVAAPAVDERVEPLTQPNTCDAQAPSQATAPAATPRLRESGLHLIQSTLAACDGNVSDTAKRLGVSRGLIYRRLRASDDLRKG